MSEKNHLYMGGKWVRSRSNHSPAIITNPANEQVVAHVVQGGPADAVRAIESARVAFDYGPWPRLSPPERCRYMLRMAAAINEHKDQIIDLLVREAGSTRTLAETAQFRIPVEDFIDMAERVVSGLEVIEGIPPITSKGLGQGAVLREPIGVASLITAYNFPFLLNLRKMGPALGAGCTVILKPSPLTPLLALIFGEIADEADLPPGVLNIVTGGADVGMELCTNPMVDMVSFTGSEVVGKEIARNSAATLKKLVLELGGKSANIVFDDADLPKAAANIAHQMTLHCGQGCGLRTRTIAQNTIYTELTEAVVENLAKIRVGDPAEPDVNMGPLISGHQRERVEGFIRSGIDEGASVAFGGARPPRIKKGYFLEPTLFVNVKNAMKIAQEEIFGPVGAMIPFKDEDEAVGLANDSRYGLSGGIWTGDTLRAFHVAKLMRTGFVNINGGAGRLSFHGPYGGYKQSGLGREIGRYGLDEFLQLKQMSWPAGNP